MKRKVFTVGAASGLADFLRGALDLSDEEIRALIERGAVYRQGKRCREVKAPLAAGEAITVVLEEGGKSALAPAPVPGPSPVVLYEDEALLAVNKPAGLPAQPTPSGSEPALTDWVRKHLGREGGLVHRLDRGTSGVTVFGKGPRATAALAAAFREGTARKRYLAACGPALDAAGVVELPLSKDPSRPGRWRASRTANGVPATTRYERLHRAEDFCLVALYPATGRTHQLRAHLTALGAPILGDAVYGGAPRAGGVEVARSLLHAQALAIPHPAGRALLLEAPLPEDLSGFFTRAGVATPAGDVATGGRSA